MDKGGGDGGHSEEQRRAWEEPTRSDPLTHDIGRDLEQDVRDIEDGENDIIVVAFETKVLLQAGNLGIA